VLDLVKRLPDDCTFEDVQYQVYVRSGKRRLASTLITIGFMSNLLGCRAI
jgi:hypothetical protein